MRGSVRARITTAATVVVAVALIAGSSALVVFGRSALVTDVRDNLTDSLTEASKSL
ncbi:MAG: two-component sensor histidine kinase, partial [Actinobacteria bacterium]|nr:two-component sensor histidine kinase [Actinomycetota bacterium]